MNVSMELSKSSRAMCIVCSRKIRRFAPRLIFGLNNFICYSCAEKWLDKNIEMLKQRKKEWQTYLRKYSREAVIGELKDG